MIPQWISGAAARDAMSKRPIGGARLPGDSPSGEGFRGVLSFMGIVLIAAATVTQAVDAHLSLWLACSLAALAAAAAWWAAYRTRGPLGVVAATGLSMLSACSVYFLQNNGNGGGWFWPLAVLLLVGLDQWSLKSARR